MAASKGADGKLWCELLSSEKHSNPEEYKGNESSHHFSIKVGLIRFSVSSASAGTAPVPDVFLPSYSLNELLDLGLWNVNSNNLKQNRIN